MDEEPKTIVLKEGETVVSQKTLTSILEKQAELEKNLTDEQAKREGLEAMINEVQGANTTGEKKLRERKSFEPAFRTVGIKKYPIAGDHENMGYVIGFTNRGAYQKVDRSGVAPVVIDYIDILFLGKERNNDGKLQAESVPLLSLINAEEVNCKILDIKKEENRVPTGEEINISVWDPKHGLTETGETIDGWVNFTERKFVIQIPGVAEPFTIDERFVNI